MTGYYIVQEGDSRPFVVALASGANSMFLARMAVARKRGDRAVSMVYRLQFGVSGDVGCAPISAAEYWEALRNARDGGQPAVLPTAPIVNPPAPARARPRSGIMARAAL